MKLTEKQERFCRYYLDCDGNASEAYRMAYDCSNMKNETIWSNASRLLASTKVAARVNQLREERAEESKVDRKKVEKVLMDIIGADPIDLYTVNPETGRMMLRKPNQIPKRARNALKSIRNDNGKVTYEFNGKTEAARLLASMNGWTAPKELSVTSGGKPVTELRIGFDEE